MPTADKVAFIVAGTVLLVLGVTLAGEGFFLAGDEKTEPYTVAWSTQRIQGEGQSKSVTGPGTVTFEFPVPPANLTLVRIDFTVRADGQRLAATSPDITINAPNGYVLNTSADLPRSPDNEGSKFHEFTLAETPTALTVEAVSPADAAERLNSTYSDAEWSGTWRVEVAFESNSLNSPLNSYTAIVAVTYEWFEGSVVA